MVSISWGLAFEVEVDEGTTNKWVALKAHLEYDCMGLFAISEVLLGCQVLEKGRDNEFG